jgi:uncharacterized protein
VTLAGSGLDGTTIERIEFESAGARVVGNLHVPASGDARGWIVLTGPFSSVKEQVTGLYAEQFARRGYPALAFDHRHWGESEGEPRFHEDGAAKVEDLRNAMSFMTTRDEVDPGRIAVCGVCLGGAYAIRFAAFDPRVKALALIGVSYNNPQVLRERFGGPEAFRRLMSQFSEISRRQFETGEIEYWPAVNPDGMPAGLPGPEPAEYYGTERGAATRWENRCTALSVMEELTIDTSVVAPLVAPTPLLIVHGTGDQACPGADARSAFDAAGEPKEFAWIETTNHIDLYDQGGPVSEAIDRAVSFFDARL